MQKDLKDDDIVKDCFGRTRHANYKEDFSGIGSFIKECKTLKIIDIVIPDRSKPMRDLLRVFYEAFATWGDLVDIHLNVGKCIGFVKYSHRYYAEFAREAMNNQAIFGGTDPISIRWAITNPFEKKEQEQEESFQHEIENFKAQKIMTDKHLKNTLKDVNKKLGGGKRQRDNENFEENLMDEHKRIKQSEEDEQPSNKQIADNLSKLSSVFQRMDAQN